MPPKKAPKSVEPTHVEPEQQEDTMSLAQHGRYTNLSVDEIDVNTVVFADDNEYNEVFQKFNEKFLDVSAQIMKITSERQECIRCMTELHDKYKEQFGSNDINMDEFEEDLERQLEDEEEEEEEEQVVVEKPAKSAKAVKSAKVAKVVATPKEATPKVASAKVATPKVATPKVATAKVATPKVATSKAAKQVKPEPDELDELDAVEELEEVEEKKSTKSAKTVKTAKVAKKVEPAKAEPVKTATVKSVKKVATKK